MAQLADMVEALSRRGILRFASLTLLLALAQGYPAAGHAEIAWPDICQSLTGVEEPAPDAIRHYRMLLNDRPAGRETFRFWHESDQVRVVVETRLEGRVLLFPAGFRHCRTERWQQQNGKLELIGLQAATRYAAPFKPEQEIHIERDPVRAEMIYRGSSSIGSFEERYPGNVGATTPWSIRTVDYDLVLNVFDHGAFRSRSRLVERAVIDGREVAHYAMAGEWPRHLWYRDGTMIRFCGVESFGIVIEMIFEPYADRKPDVAGLSRPCALLFE